MLFSVPVKLEKAEQKDEDSRIDLTVYASDESLDREGDNISSSVFTDEVRDYFLRSGIIDYDHVCIRGENELERATALIGTPTSFYEERLKGEAVQVIEGFLHPENPYVRNAVLPVLKSRSDRLGASIGGKILDFTKNGVGGKSITKILMNHLAVTPLYKSVNTNTKAFLSQFKDDYVIEKSFKGEDILFMKSFSDFADAMNLNKSMEAGTATDSAQMTGAQALQPQSLEGARGIFRRMISDVYEGRLSPAILSDEKRAYAYIQNYTGNNGKNESLAKAIAELITKSKNYKRFETIYNKRGKI